MIFFLLGLIAVFFIIFSRSSIVGSISENNKFVKNLQKTKWFQKSYWSGSLLFLVNAVLFFGTVGILYGLSLFFIPYIHIVVMIVAVVISVWIWTIFSKAFKDRNMGRMVMASVGSSFYFCLTVLFVYMYVSIEPYYPGEDTFMRALGLSLASIVTAVACVTCFVITGFTNKRISNEKYNSITEAKNSQ